MSYRRLQADGLAELDRIRGQRADFGIYDAAERWVADVLPDLDAAEFLAAVRFAVELKRAHGSVRRSQVLDVLARWQAGVNPNGGASL